MFNLPAEFESFVPLGSVGSIYSGGTPDSGNPEYWNGDIKWCVPSDITGLDSRFISDTERMISKAGLQHSSAKLVPAGSLLVCTRATVGELAISSVPIATNQGFKNLVPSEKYNVNYLYYCVLSAGSILQRLACGSTFPEISKRDFSRISVPDIPLSEQIKIAEILGACDEAIETQERLIAQKQERKKGLMQRLLTGKTRFPQFAGKPWKEVRLEDVLRKEKGKVVNPTGKGLPIIGSVAFDGDFDQFSDDSDAVRVNETDLLILWDGEYAGKTTTGKVGLASSTVAVGRPKVDLSTSFLDAFLRLHNPRIRAIREGSGIPHMPADFFQWQRVPFPPIEEQAAIAAILSAQDEEIDLQQKKLEQLKQQKKGLMQRLLTGKVRVKV